MHVLVSAYLSRARAPSLCCPVLGNSILLLQTNTQSSERIAATGIYLQSEKGRCDSAMVENSTLLKNFDVSKQISVCFPKVPLFVIICSIDNRRHFHEHSRRHWLTCNHNPGREFCIANITRCFLNPLFFYEMWIVLLHGIDCCGREALED